MAETKDGNYMKLIATQYSANAKGHYSPGVMHNGIHYVSGQISLNLDTRKKPDKFEDEVVQALNNVELVLKAAGLSKNNVMMIRAFIPSIELWDDFNVAYAGWFGDHKPARIVVPCRELHYGCRVEIEAVAAAE
jgi:reactive intermediate/imine deaminase